jgi:hypothetical protein
MIIESILVLAGVSAVASIINLIDSRKASIKTVSLQKQMPGNLPIISLSNNNKVFNFILDSGSNISHICEKYYKNIISTPLGVFADGEVTGLGGKDIGVTMCEAMFKDVAGHEYNIKLSVSKGLNAVIRNIKEATGVQVHGLLGTDFLRDYNYVLDFKTLEVYPQ